ncbi:MAG: DUF429 domain-containing protein [Candidatus Rokuibacteriota bacterium]
MPSRALPALVAHADWSCDPRKRWMAIGHLRGQRYELGVPRAVGDVATLFQRLARLARGGQVIVGFDFPIGLPLAYARGAGIERFLDVLPAFGAGAWRDFYHVATRPHEIGIGRPFYPFRPDRAAHAHLTSALGVADMHALRRACDRGGGQRRDACPIFWTLGRQQVGRAAIAGWRDLLAPAVREKAEVTVWPFHGSLPDLLRRSPCIVAETYPAEACLHLGLPAPGRGWSKRDPEGRRRQGARLLAWAAQRDVHLAGDLKRAIRAGFGTLPAGDDPFDSLLGVMAIVEVLLGARTDGAPADPAVANVEGWIFGQQPRAIT